MLYHELFMILILCLVIITVEESRFQLQCITYMLLKDTGSNLFLVQYDGSSNLINVFMKLPDPLRLMCARVEMKKVLSYFYNCRVVHI